MNSMNPMKQGYGLGTAAVLTTGTSNICSVVGLHLHHIPSTKMKAFEALKHLEATHLLVSQLLLAFAGNTTVLCYQEQECLRDDVEMNM